MRYTSKDDAIERAFPEDVTDTAYDVDAIFAAAFDYRVDRDGDGNELMNTAGFEQVVSEDEFWALAVTHERRS